MLTKDPIYEPSRCASKQEGMMGVFLTHASSSGVDQNTRTVNTSPKIVEKKKGRFNIIIDSAVMEYVMENNTQGEILYLTSSAQLFHPHPPANPPSLVCLLDTPRKPVSVGIRIYMTILYTQYSSLRLGSYKQY